MILKNDCGCPEIEEEICECEHECCSGELISTEEEDRCIKIFGEVDDDADIAIWSALRSFQKKDPEGMITLYINSVGGCIQSMFSIIDAMDACSCPIRTIGVGKVYSSAIGILSAGTPGERYASKSCRLMLHSSQWGDSAQHGEMIVSVKEAETVQNMYIDIIVKNTQISPKKAKQIFQAGPSTYWSVNEALRLGIIDKTLEEIL